MSEQNVEVVRRAWEAFVRRDNETVLAAYDPDVAIESFVDGQVYRGLAERRMSGRSAMASLHAPRL